MKELSKVVSKSMYWRELALVVMEEREKVRKGWSNKVGLGTCLARSYAYALTAVKRRS